MVRRNRLVVLGEQLGPSVHVAILDRGHAREEVPARVVPLHLGQRPIEKRRVLFIAVVFLPAFVPCHSTCSALFLACPQRAGNRKSAPQATICTVIPSR